MTGIKWGKSTLVHAYDVNLWQDNININKKNAVTLSDARNDVGLEVDLEVSEGYANFIYRD
jgi:hypothetical protein